MLFTVENCARNDHAFCFCAIRSRFILTAPSIFDYAIVLSNLVTVCLPGMATRHDSLIVFQLLAARWPYKYVTSVEVIRGKPLFLCGGNM